MIPHLSCFCCFLIAQIGYSSTAFRILGLSPRTCRSPLGICIGAALDHWCMGVTRHSRGHTVLVQIFYEGTCFDDVLKIVQMQFMKVMDNDGLGSTATHISCLSYSITTIVQRTVRCRRSAYRYVVRTVPRYKRARGFLVAGPKQVLDAKPRGIMAVSGDLYSSVSLPLRYQEVVHSIIGVFSSVVVAL